MIISLNKGLSIIKSFLEPIGKFVSNIVNFILLAFVYVFGIGLVSVVAKICGKHFLELKKHGKKSNWQEHKVTKEPLEKYYRTF